MNYGDCIQKTYRRLMSGSRVQIVQLISDSDPGAQVIQLAGGFTGAVQDGAILSVDLELFLVLATTTAGAITVVPGYLGSTPAAHVKGSEVYINPRFSFFDIGVAINDDLLDLSSPTNGLGRVGFMDVTYNPTFMGYDLGTSFVTPTSRVLEVSYQIAPPVRTYPLIRRGDYRVIRNANQPTVFPSGNGIVLYKSAYPGLPVHIQFLAPFNPLVNLDDDLVTIGGLSNTMLDLPDLGAAIKLMQPREVKRNFIAAQPDPRKAQEVPPNAVANSSAKLEQQRQMRINTEADRIMSAYPMAESF